MDWKLLKDKDTGDIPIVNYWFPRDTLGRLLVNYNTTRQTTSTNSIFFDTLIDKSPYYYSYKIFTRNLNIIAYAGVLLHENYHGYSIMLLVTVPSNTNIDNALDISISNIYVNSKYIDTTVIKTIKKKYREAGLNVRKQWHVLSNNQIKDRFFGAETVSSRVLTNPMPLFKQLLKQYESGTIQPVSREKEEAPI